MPPELLLTGRIKPSCDVYSFGIICEGAAMHARSLLHAPACCCLPYCYSLPATACLVTQGIIY